LRKLIRNRERYHIYFYFIKYLTPNAAGITTYYYLQGEFYRLQAGQTRNQGQIPSVGKDSSLLHRVQTDSRANSAFYPGDTGVPSLGNKAQEA
jgi:hypothetical protein